MSTNINLPALGESVTEGTVTRWLKKVGDAVAVDEPIVEISTDKVDTEVPSPVAGVLEEIFANEDDVIAVGAPLARIGDGGGSSAAPTAAPAETAPIAEAPVSEPEIASVGLGETVAKEQYGEANIAVYDYNLAGNGKSHILETSGSIKVVRVIDGPVVGVHMIGARVGELIGEAQLIVNWEAHPEDIAPHLHAHPTQNEALGEAFLALAGKPLHAM